MVRYWNIDCWFERLWIIVIERIIWALIYLALLFICFWATYRVGYINGYKRGAHRVLEEWKRDLRLLDEQSQ